MPKRVLLTGGAGAIGVHVIAHFLNETDWHITVLDSLRHKGDRSRIHAYLEDHQDWAERVTILQHDLVCPISRALAAAIGPVNYILHLAAISDVPYAVDNPRYTIVNNVASTITMLDYAAETEHEAFVYFSTDEVYGPKPVAADGHQEWDHFRPSNPYSASKAAGELFAYSYWRAGHVELIITNSTNNFGETQGASKYPALIQHNLLYGKKITVHGNERGIGSRCYIHSVNTADALLHILTNTTPYRHTPGAIDTPHKYHIVGAETLNNLELAQLIASMMGRELDFDLVDYPHQAHDIHYGLKDVELHASGWKPPVSLTESLKRTVEWNQRHPGWL